jgi:hypothetical protein
LRFDGLVARGSKGSSQAPLPTWVCDLFKIGRWLGGEPHDGKVRILCVALPSLDYAAALIATGVVLERLERSSCGREGWDVHLGQVLALPAGSPVFLRRGDRVLDGRLLGVELVGGSRYIRVQVGNADGGGTCHLVPLDAAHRIALAPQGRTLPKAQKGRRVNGPSEFLQAVLGQAIAAQHWAERRHEVVVIGSRSRVRSELEEVWLESPALESAGVRGSLMDFVRPRDFCPKREGFASRLLSARPGVLDRPFLPPSAAVVLDGASSFLRARAISPARHTVVLLGRGEARFDDALDVLERDLAARGEALESPAVRSLGVEVMGFSLVKS